MTLDFTYALHPVVGNFPMYLAVYLQGFDNIRHWLAYL